ncbi:haloacid dehalogenase type II [Gordonia sp. NPDC003429]
MTADGVRVLAFDTFGTLTDWFTGISDAVARSGLGVDPAEFTRDWRSRYAPILARVESGELPWANLDALHHITLRDTAHHFGVEVDDDAAASLVRAWHELPAWPDATPGIRRLRTRFVVCALSNGDVRLLVDLARHNDFGWDLAAGADLWQHYKPSPETYLGLARLMQVEPAQVMMVATHQSDLDAARSNGLRTAFVARPDEWGGAAKDDSGSPANDVHAGDVLDLADRLGV